MLSAHTFPRPSIRYRLSFLTGWAFGRATVAGLEGEQKDGVNKRIDGLSGGYGSILFCEDLAVVEGFAVRGLGNRSECVAWDCMGLSCCCWKGGDSTMADLASVVHQVCVVRSTKATDSIDHSGTKALLDI
ncbi:unnamed protein product [Mycena citricolor]|uniref:Uncharacterized protein n=1 Tax=Mycena citricolor TaxID=2018698 RepID=A0AAD2H823_9AGAR|nr:unnamed protein product [Mycena citricolor]